MKYFTWTILFKPISNCAKYECYYPHFTEEEAHMIGKFYVYDGVSKSAEIGSYLHCTAVRTGIQITLYVQIKCLSCFVSGGVMPLCAGPQESKSREGISLQQDPGALYDFNLDEELEIDLDDEAMEAMFGQELY